MKIIQLKDNEPYAPIVARVIIRGDRYGRNGALTHGFDTPLIEFYDARYGEDWESEAWHKDEFVGQFVSRMYLDTLMQHPVGYGLDLDMGVEDWSLTPGTFAKVLSWAQNVTGVRRNVL